MVGGGRTASTRGGEFVSRERITRASLQMPLSSVGTLADAVVEQVEIGVKYAGYIDKQNDEVEGRLTTRTRSCQRIWTTCRCRR